MKTREIEQKNKIAAAKKINGDEIIALHQSIIDVYYTRGGFVKLIAEPLCISIDPDYMFDNSGEYYGSLINFESLLQDLQSAAEKINARVFFDEQPGIYPVRKNK